MTGNHVPAETRVLIAERYTAGETAKAIASDLGLNYKTVLRHLRLAGVDVLPYVSGRPRTDGRCVVCRGETDVYKSYCRDCRTERMRWGHIQRKYGLSKQAYFDLLDERGGRCPICGAVPPYDLKVDHDHETGNVRGALCQRCNLGLGFLGDDLAGLTRALHYLEAAACRTK